MLFGVVNQNLALFSNSAITSLRYCYFFFQNSIALTAFFQIEMETIFQFRRNLKIGPSVVYITL